MKNMKSFLVVAALAVVIVGVGNWMNSDGTSLQGLISGKKAPVVSATPVSTASTDNAMYNKLLGQYRTARIQFKGNCQASPTMASYKNGTSIMLDNRSSQARTVSVGGVAYPLPGYGYQVITVTSTTFPGTVAVNCGNSVNVATLRISQ